MKYLTAKLIFAKNRFSYGAIIISFCIFNEVVLYPMNTEGCALRTGWLMFKPVATSATIQREKKLFSDKCTIPSLDGFHNLVFICGKQRRKK